MADLLTPAEFFFIHAGWSYDPHRQSQLEGRTECARALAMAERWASDCGISFEWAVDEDPIECSYGDGDGVLLWDQWVCRAYDSDGELLDSLGSVDFGQDCDPWSGDPYRRVIEAELSLGLLQGDNSRNCVDFLAIRPEIVEDADSYSR